MIEGKPNQNESFLLVYKNDTCLNIYCHKAYLLNLIYLYAATLVYIGDSGGFDC